MRSFWVHHGKWAALGMGLALTSLSPPGLALDKPTGAPLELSSIETEQAIPLAILDPDGKTARCVLIKLHWNPKADVGANDDATQFDLDIGADTPGASIFTAQLWNASLASATAWQQPWQGARWKVLQTPATDGSGINAALAVGMISTSARRLYPKDTVVIGSLNPDGSLGAVSRLAERIDAAAAAGIKRVIIPSVQRFDTDASGQVLNIVRHAGDLNLDCIPVDNLVEATETAMDDPLPDSTLDSSTPKYSNEVATYIDQFAHREQLEAEDGLRFAPKEADLASYPLRLAALWRSIYADNDAGTQAYRAGQVYVAYRLFAQANGRMRGVNALGTQSRVAFDVKTALADSDDLRQRLHEMMTPPSIDKGELESAVLVAEMADWAYDINAELEGAQLVTKQTYSQRSDATQAEKDRARDELLFAIEESKYLLEGADFYHGLLDHIGNNSPMPVDENAAHLLPQLIPAQLATAQLFTDGIRPRANDMRDGLLFDPRLAAYVNVLRETKAAWDARQRKKALEAEAATPPAAPATSPATATSSNTITDNATKLNAASATAGAAFDPGGTYAPPHTVLVASEPVKKLSDVAACLIWVNNDCEIATLDEKYLRLNGTIDPATHEWHVKDRAKLDALLQAAEVGARHGIAFAEKAEVDSSVLGMIYEKATHARIQGDDAAALDALRNYWRCALLGNICWQLAHTRKAEPVDLSSLPPEDDKDKKGKEDGKKPEEKSTAKQEEKPKTPAPAATNVVVAPTPPSAGPVVGPVAPAATNIVVGPTPPPASPVVIPVAPTLATNVVVAPNPPPPTNPTATPVAPAATNTMVEATPPEVPVAHVANSTIFHEPPRALPVIDDSATNAAPSPAPPAPPSPPPAPAATTNSEPVIPVAPIAKDADLTGGDTDTMPPPTNAPPVVGPTPPAPTGANP